MADYSYYFRALAGDYSNPPDITDPQPGFYRHHGGDPVAYFPQDIGKTLAGVPIIGGERLACVRAGREQSREQMLNLWPMVAGSPIPEGEWRNVAAGGDWPDEAPGLGHNRPPEDAGPEARAARTIDLAEQWLKRHETVEDRNTADQAAHYMTELRQVVGDLEEAEKRAMQPWSAILLQVRAKFTKWIAPAQTVRTDIDKRLKPFLKAEDERNRAAREEARRKADEAAAEGKRAPAPAPRTRVGGRGHAVSLRSYWSAKIEDYVTALEACATDPEVEKAVQSIANRWARESNGKNPLPGTEPVEDRR